MIQKVFKAAIMLLKKKFGEEASWVSLSEQIEIPDDFGDFIPLDWC